MGIMLLVVGGGLLMKPEALHAQNITEKKGKPEIAELMHSGAYTFEAQRAMAQNGFSKILTSDYTLSVSKDTVQANLPYFGRAYQAPMDPSKGGIQFTSTDFEYKISRTKRGMWNVKIQPKGHQDVMQLNLSVSGSGFATLQVISLNRQPISFYGKIVSR